MHVAINDEQSFEEYAAGTRVVGFATEAMADFWVAQQPDFGDWVVVPVEEVRTQ